MFTALFMLLFFLTGWVLLVFSWMIEDELLRLSRTPTSEDPTNPDPTLQCQIVFSMQIPLRLLIITSVIFIVMSFSYFTCVSQCEKFEAVNKKEQPGGGFYSVSFLLLSIFMLVNASVLKYYVDNQPNGLPTCKNNLTTNWAIWSIIGTTIGLLVFSIIGIWFNGRLAADEKKAKAAKIAMGGIPRGHSGHS